MATGNQNLTSDNLLRAGFVAAQADAVQDSIQSNVTAVGTTIGTAATSIADIVLIGSAATGNTGFQLRKGNGFKKRQIVINMGPGSAVVYPPTGGVVNNTTSVTLTSGSQAVFASVDLAGLQYWKT